MKRIQDYVNCRNPMGLRGFRFEPGLPVHFRVGELEREIPVSHGGRGGSLRAFHGEASVLVVGVADGEEVLSMLSCEEVELEVELDLRGMGLLCSVALGDGQRFYLDPSCVDLMQARYCGKSFGATVRNEFAVECSASRSAFAGDSTPLYFDFCASMIPDSVSLTRFAEALRDAGRRLCPRAVIHIRDDEQRYLIRSMFDQYRRYPIFEYLLHRELRVVDPSLRVEDWLQETSEPECHAFVDLIDRIRP